MNALDVNNAPRGFLTPDRHILLLVATGVYPLLLITEALAIAVAHHAQSSARSPAQCREVSLTGNSAVEIRIGVAFIGAILFLTLGANSRPNCWAPP